MVCKQIIDKDDYISTYSVVDEISVLLKKQMVCYCCCVKRDDDYFSDY